MYGGDDGDSQGGRSGDAAQRCWLDHRRTHHHSSLHLDHPALRSLAAGRSHQVEDFDGSERCWRYSAPSC